MFIYWVLFAYPAAMALAFPVEARRHLSHRTQSGAMMGFLLFYVALGGLRFDTGGDWYTYFEIFLSFEQMTLLEAIESSDPLYGILNWVSAQIGAGIYPVNAVCCWLIGYGTIAVARQFREPWMAIVMAIPYLLIVVGLGYVRQGAAIGLILTAIANLDRAKPIRTIVLLTLAMGFHSSAVIVIPLFAVATVQGNRLLAFTVTLLAALFYQFVVAPRIDYLDAGYIGRQYDSSGAAVRVMMGVVPAVAVLLMRHRFVADPQARTMWMLIALANPIALVALGLSPSSTAVDRVALYFSVIQLAAYGEFRDLFAVSSRNVMIVRLGLIALAGLVQVIWLVFAIHAEFWVPYKSILQTLGT